jgi:hypothetical protein
MTIQRMDHVGIVVDDLAVGEVERYEDGYRLCYVAARRGSASNWPSRSAEGSSRPYVRVTAPLRC